MGYVKFKWDKSVWAKGQQTFEKQLNHIESGIAEAGGGGEPESQTFPAEFNVTGTTQEFGQSVLNYSGFKMGRVWLGTLKCSDLPAGMIRAECIVTALQDKTVFPRNIAVIEVHSSNRNPYYWIYNTDSWSEGSPHDEWKCVMALPAPSGTDGTYVLKCTKSGSSVSFNWVKE